MQPGKIILVQDPIDNGFTAFVTNSPIIVAEGDTVSEAIQNLGHLTKDVELHLSSSHRRRR